jgi:signal transduction histidine kinase
LPPAHNQSVLLTVCVRHDGSVWGGTDGAGVFRWENVQGMRPAEQVGLSGAQVYALLEDSRSNLWAGASTGLFQFRNGRFEQVAGAPLARRVTALYEDRAGKLWAGTARGLIGFGGATPVSFNQRSGLPTGQIMAVTRDQADRFWVAVAGRGLFHEEGGQFKLWTSGNGEPAPPSRWSDGRYSRSLLPDRDGSIWIGTYGYGLFRIDGGRLRWWSWQFDGLPSNHILDLQADDAGNLWCSSENGIFGYAKKTLLDYLGAGSPRPIPLRLTKAEGLPYKVCSGGGQPTGAKTRDGRLWFPNAAALVSFDPAAAPRSQQTRPPLVEELRVDGLAQPITPGFPLRIMSGARSFEFVFTSPNMLTPTRLRFRYRLEGLDEDWALEGNQRSVKYSALTPGKYTFRVMARDSDEGWTGPEAALPLIIVPRWWELSSVRLAGGLILLGAIAVIARQGERARSRRKLAVVERERALERERARIARDIHDDLGASLTQVALLGDMAAGASGSPEEMRMQTRQISEAAHEMVQSLEAIVWAVRPENDTLRSLVEYMNRRTDELFEKMPRQYQFTAPAILPACSVHAEVRHNVFLAYKEALTNALKHAQASAVRIAVACDNSTCRITITDNGRGFDARIVRAGGTGLKNMRLRLEEIGGRAEVQSQPGQGTTARLEFSLSREGRA